MKIQHNIPFQATSEINLRDGTGQGVQVETKHNWDPWMSPPRQQNPGYAPASIPPLISAPSLLSLSPLLRPSPPVADFCVWGAWGPLRSPPPVNSFVALSYAKAQLDDRRCVHLSVRLSVARRY